MQLSHNQFKSIKRSQRSKYLSRVLALAVTGAAGQLAHAATWEGDVSQNWNDVQNWSGNVAPTGNFIINTTLAGVFPIVSADSAFTPVDILIGNGAGTSGRLDLTAGTLSTGNGNWLIMGIDGGDATFNMSGGTLHVGELHMARTNNGTDASVVSFTMTAGTVNNDGWAFANDSTNGGALGQGTLSINGGTYNVGGSLVASSAGAATSFGQINIGVGGTVNLNGTNQMVVVNQWDTTQGRVNVNGGTLNLNNGSDIRFSSGSYAPGAGTGVSNFTMSSGLVTGNAGTVIDFNNNADNAVNNTFNLDGGTLTIGQVVSTKGGGTRVFNFNGGTLKVAGTNAAFMSTTATSRTNVRNGGAIIDTNGFDVTIGQALLHSNVGGDTAIDGGLTKNGTGTLTLSNANTFTGGVVVSGGTLYATTGNAANNRAFSFVSGITVNNGATLRTSSNALFGWDGSQDKNILVNAGGTLLGNGGLGSDIGVGTVTLAGGTLATLTTGATDWGSWRFDNAGDKLVVTADSVVSATNVKFQNGGLIDIATGVTLDVSGTITDSINGGVSTLIKSGGSGKLLLSGNSTYSGVTNIAAGTLQVGNGNAATLGTGGTYAGAITNSGTLIFNSTATQSLTGGITGGGALTKDGSGTLSISNTSALGVVSLLNGRLNVNGTTTAGNINAANGTTLGFKVTNAVANVLSIGGNGLSLDTNTFAVDFAAINPTASIVNMSSGALTLNGTIASTFVGGSALTNGTYVLIDYGTLAGSGSFSGSQISLGSARSTGVVSNDAANTNIILTVSADKPVWTGVNGSAWVGYAQNSPLSGSPNFALKSAHTTADFWTGDDVEFNDTYNLGAGDVAVANSTVNVDAAGVSPSSVTFNNSAVNYTIGGPGGIATGSLIKNGTGGVVLLNANGYIGETFINAGTLQLGDGTTDGSITNSVAITNNGTLIYNRSTGSTFTYANVISGTGTVIKNGAGTQILTAANTYTGGTSINGGILQIGTTTGAANTGTFNLNGATFQVSVGAFANYAATINLTADSNFSNVGAGQINYSGTLAGTGNVLTVSNGPAPMYMNGTVSGINQINVTSGAMGFDLGAGNRGGGAPVDVSTGAALWFWGAANSIANNLTFHGGDGLNGVGALYYEGGSPTPAPITGNIALTSGITSMGGQYAADTVKIAGQISGAGGLTKISADTYVLTGTNSYTGATSIAAGTLQIGDGTTDGSIDTSSGITDNGTLHYNLINNYTYALSISGTGKLIKSGAGVLVLSATNTYTGTTTVNNGATLALTGANTLSTGNVVLNNGATLQLEANAGNTTAGSSSVLGSNSAAGSTGLQLGNDNNGSVNIKLRSDTSVEFANTTTGNNSGNVTLNFDVNSVSVGPQNQVLTFAPASETGRNNGLGLSTFNTNIIVNGGNGYELAIGKISSFGSQLTVNAATANVTIGTAGSPFGGSTFNFTGAANTTVTGGVTANVTALNKLSTGSLTLQGAGSNYVGVTNVNGGKLLVNGTHTGGAAYTVNTGGTLGGNGSIITAGNAGVTVAAGGKLSPGASIGTLTMDLGTGSLNVSGAVTNSNSQSLLFDIGATGDKIVLANNTVLNIGSGVLEFDDFAFTDVGGLAVGTYTLVDSSIAINGTFGSVLSGTIGNGIEANLEFADSGNDLVLNITVAPEPTSMGVIGLGACGLLGRRRRKQTR